MRDDAWWQIDQLSVPGRASSVEELGLPGERGGFFSGNGAMSVLQGTTLRKSETTLKIGTKPVKMLLKSPKAQKGMAFHSCVGMVILSQAVVNTVSGILTSRSAYHSLNQEVGMLFWTKAR